MNKNVFINQLFVSFVIYFFLSLSLFIYLFDFVVLLQTNNRIKHRPAPTGSSMWPHPAARRPSTRPSFQRRMALCRRTLHWALVFHVRCPLAAILWAVEPRPIATHPWPPAAVISTRAAHCPAPHGIRQRLAAPLLSPIPNRPSAIWTSLQVPPPSCVVIQPCPPQMSARAHVARASRPGSATITSRWSTTPCWERKYSHNHRD